MRFGLQKNLSLALPIRQGEGGICSRKNKSVFVSAAQSCWQLNKTVACGVKIDYNGKIVVTRSSRIGGTDMPKTADQLASEVHSLSDVEKLRLVDTILADLDKPDPEIDRIWAEESRKRWAAYRAGRIPTVSYQKVMEKHRSS
jgi:putative addiction module component (TIGR02574 family)